MYLTRKTILQHEVTFEVGNDGKFSAHIPESKSGNHRFIVRDCDSLKQAQRAVRLELKKLQIRVAVPFTYLDNSSPTADSTPRSLRERMLPAIAKGRHATTRDMLIWIDDGSENGRSTTITTRYWAHDSQQLLPNISNKDLDRLQRIYAARANLQQKLERAEELITEWREKHTFNLLAAVDEAITVAAQELIDNPPDIGTDDDTDGTDDPGFSEDDKEVDSDD